MFSAFTWMKYPDELHAHLELLRLEVSLVGLAVCLRPGMKASPAWMGYNDVSRAHLELLHRGGLPGIQEAIGPSKKRLEAEQANPKLVHGAPDWIRQAGKRVRQVAHLHIIEAGYQIPDDQIESEAPFARTSRSTSWQFNNIILPGWQTRLLDDTSALDAARPSSGAGPG